MGKKINYLLIILFLNPIIGFSQKTYVPDNMFEYSLEGMGMGDSIPLNDSVWTSAIDTLTFLDISFNLGTTITSLKGIEDMNNLEHLEIKFQNIDSVDLTNNSALYYVHLRDNHTLHVDVRYLTALEHLILDENQISEIDLTFNANLIYFACQYNQITSLDLSNQPHLQGIHCWDNQITSLDLSSNFSLLYLNCENNALTELDIKNEWNWQITDFKVSGNNDLYCINVDDSTWASNTWNFWPDNNIDPWHYFSENCDEITEIKETLNHKKILKTINILGRETKRKKNQPLFYIYNDGTVEKRITID